MEPNGTIYVLEMWFLILRKVIVLVEFVIVLVLLVSDRKIRNVIPVLQVTIFNLLVRQ